MNKLRRGIALFLSITMVATLMGCGQKDKEKEKSNVINYEGKTNITASSDTKWIDSDIYGLIDETLDVSEKDDFYTAVNKDWLLEQPKPTDDHDNTSMISSGSEIVKDRLIGIVSGKGDPDAFDGSQVDIEDDEIAHDQDLVVQFVDAASDWDSRNKAGVEPLRQYIEDIAAISSMDEFTDYMTDIDGRNISQESMLGFTVYAGIVDAENYRCLVSPNDNYVLYDQRAYKNMSLDAHEDMHLTNELATDILKKLGYEDAYIKKTLANCYKLEGMLIDHSNDKLSQDIEEYAKGVTTLDGLVKLSGKYPFEKVYKAYGYTATDDIRIADKAYLKYLDKIYTSSNLELLKSYFIVHTINNNILLLDRNYYDKVTERENQYNANNPSTNDDGDGDVEEQEIKDEWDIILNKYAMPYVGGPLNVVYISRYCSLEQKKEIENIIDEVIKNYHKIIDGEEWLTESAKEATHEKLDYITVRAVYPDKMDSFKEIEFTEADNLVTMAQKLNAYNIRLQAKKVNTPVDKKIWNLMEQPTTVTNAYYRPDENSINVLAGIIASEDIFNTESPDEVNYAKIGTIIGHEISHAFDSNGCNYDKYGYNESWWDVNDITTFSLRVLDISQYYSGIIPYPGATPLFGSTLTGEVIADMGGVKVMLMAAKEKSDFDYDLFFRSYAELWRTSRSLGMEEVYASQDEHPLSYLRTNVTLTQFDEFMETYDIKEGDGMYWDPEKRIAVW